jgi:RHS repeat-associated protein
MVAMTESSVKAMLVSLNLSDTPVRYTPPVGPAMLFTVQYNQRDNTQPTTFTYANLGPGWTFSYLSYITPGSSTSTVYQRGGGVETFYYNSGTSSWYPSQMSQDVLSQVNSTTWQRAFPNGEIETYGQPDGSGRFFLTKITDPLGNALTLTYDSNFRLSSLTDALGQVTNVTYRSNTATNLPAFYQIAKVTDPFSRYAQFDYDSNNRLQKITDIVGITSQFTYLSNNFVTSLTTPYGVTNFAYGDVTTNPSLGTTRWMNVTYPDGNATRTEYNETQTPGGVSGGVDTAGIPSGMYPGITATNNYMQYRNTYFWDKQALKDHPGDYTKAKVTHWLHTSDINTVSDIEESHKSVNQNRIWFGYTGQISSLQASSTMIAKPTQKGRILDDGTTQLFTYAYNALGKVTQEIDPLGRETDYAYATNNIDLLTVKQKNGSSYDLLATYTYNSQHEVLTAKDASGQTTTNTYYANGELHTVTNAKSQVTTYAYNTSNYLTSVTGPVTGATTSFTYDGYGRARTVTDSQGYVTTTDYDAMDRPTQVTYPDTTTSQFTYQRLDLQFSKDRLGRWTHVFYNSLRQPMAVMDALGHVTTSNWTLSAGLGSMVDPSGNLTVWKHDGQNRVTEKDYPDGHHESIAYETTTSRVKSVTDNIGEVATNTYFKDNTVSQTVYTNATVATPTVTCTYDSIYPRISTIANGTGTTITYLYNAITTTPTLGAGRLYSVAGPLATTSYAYDELGRQLSQTVGSTASSVTYDTLGRVATATNALSATAFTYNYLGNTGRVSSMSDPNGQSTVYTYQDSSGTGEPRLSEIKNLNSSSAVISKFDYGYDAQGQITSWTQQTDANDPQNDALQYDNAGRLVNATVTDTTTSALLHQYAYSYDATGNRTGEQIDGAVTTSSYNNLNQLTGQGAGGKMVFSGTVGEYAAVTVGGNTASLDVNNNFRGAASVTTGTNTVPVIATDVDGNVATNRYQVVVPTGSSPTYTYDLNGNLLTDGTRTFAWDAKNEMVSIVYNAGPNSGNHTEFTYNALGQRVSIVERTGTTIGAGTITSTKQYAANEELDGSSTVTKKYFAQGEQRIVSGVTTNYFYTFDHLGSIREMIASDGSTISCRYSYDPFGRRTKVSGSLDCDFGFTGYYHHANSGLDLSATRPYDPNLGRFIQRDPSGEGSGINLYAYAGDNPVCNTDPSGLCIDDPPGSNPPDLWNTPPGSNPYDDYLNPPDPFANNSDAPTIENPSPPNPYDQTLDTPPAPTPPVAPPSTGIHRPAPAYNPNKPDDTPYLKILLGFEAGPAIIVGGLLLTPYQAAAAVVGGTYVYYNTFHGDDEGSQPDGPPEEVP